MKLNAVKEKIIYFEYQTTDLKVISVHSVA